MKFNFKTLIGVVVFGLAAYAAYAETVTISTFYPSPFGNYQDLETTRNTWLSSAGGAGVTGIGLANNVTPISRLQVNGTATIGGGAAANSNGNIQIIPVGVAPNAGRITFGGAGAGWKMHISKNNGATTNDYLTVQDNGNVGINNANPAYNLDVTGTSSLNGTLRVKDSASATQGDLQISCTGGVCYTYAVYA